MGLINEFESKYWSEYPRIVGMDEAGRGPMAGPLVVSAVVFPRWFHHDDINDSKKLTAKQRLALVDLIHEHALWHKTLIISALEIDQSNIYKVTQEAMETLAKLAEADMVLTDAMPLPHYEGPFESIIKGDQRSLSIAAASILAKTQRDSIMIELDALFPQYGFKDHKGYGTAKHKAAIYEYGRCEHHRHTFRFKDEIQTALDI